MLSIEAFAVRLDFLDLYLLHWPVPSAFEATRRLYKPR